MEAPLKKFNLFIPTSLHKDAKLKSVERGISLNEFFLRAVIKALEDEDDPGVDLEGHKDLAEVGEILEAPSEKIS